MKSFDIREFFESYAGKELVEFVWHVGPGLFLVTSLIYPEYIIYVSYIVILIVLTFISHLFTVQFENSFDLSGTKVSWDPPQKQPTPSIPHSIVSTLAFIMYVGMFAILFYVTTWSFFESFRGIILDSLLELTGIYYLLCFSSTILSYFDQEFLPS